MKFGVIGFLHTLVIPAYKPGPLCGAISESMTKYPDDWGLSKHTVRHIPSGIEIWAANDVTNREIYFAPNGIDSKKVSKTLSMGDRIVIDRLIDMLRDRKEIDATDDSPRIIKLLKKKK